MVCMCWCMCVPAGEDNKELWRAHDACELVKSYKGPALPTLIDTGSADTFLEREVRNQQPTAPLQPQDPGQTSTC